MSLIDFQAARNLLNNSFENAERRLLGGSRLSLNEELDEAVDIVFTSSTQAYREVLLGCILARIQDNSIDIRCPYIDQGTYAFSGRSLDEKAINPFLHENHIPSSRGPYLSVFRRSIKFDKRTRSGLRDKNGYDAFLLLLAHLEELHAQAQMIEFLERILYEFAKLREYAAIPVSRLQRISLEQYNLLISRLLETPSGGRLPVILIVSAFSAIKQFFKLDWVIQFQGINVSDMASGAGGDITIKNGDQVLLAAEVTERSIDKARIVATFNTKIAPAGIEDYLFFVKLSGVSQDAQRQARQYFSQGHEVNFLEMKDWIVMLLATIGKEGRSIFNSYLINFIEAEDFPRFLKVKWNELITALVDSSNK